MMHRQLGRAALAILLAASASTVFAQSSGSLRGTVADATGAVVPGANVVLTNEATSFSRETVTDSTGGYFFATVDRGNYTLRVELAGFKSYQASNVQLASNATVSVNVTLELGEQTETVLVTAERDLIQTETGAREGLITPEAIEKLSILGRNPTELLRILPGVVSPNQSSFEVSGITSGFGDTGQSFSINGARPEQLSITLDGANLRDIGNNSGMMNVPNNEFVAEVKVQTSNYAAEFGTQAVSIQAVTKSGSSEFHGSAYWYNRSHQLAANDRSRSLIGQEKPKSKFNYPGFTLSGPLVLPGFNQDRDKAFFFLGFELAKQSVDEGSAFATVPTAGQRVGDFSDYLGGQNLNQPTTVNIPRGFPGAGDPAPGNNLAPYINPTGQALFGLYPDPNFADPNNRYNYVFSELAQRDRNQGIARIDFNLSDSTKMYVRYARDKDKSEKYRGLWWNVGNVATPTPINATQEGMSAVANLTSVLSPTTTNEFIFSWSRLLNDNMWQDPAQMQLATYGLTPADFSNPFGASEYVPEIVNQFAGDRGSMWFAQDVDNIFAYNGFLRFADNFTKVLNTHALKAGVVVERQYKKQNFQHQANVQLNFAPWANGTTGSDFGDLLVGRPASAAVGEPSAIGDFHAWNFEAYLQDSWKASKNLTLEYGLRFGKWTNNAEINDLGAIFSPSAYDPNAGLFIDDARTRANGFLYAATGDVDRTLRGNRPLLFMPRVNFAWDVKGDGDIVARGGYGIFYVREQGNAQYDIINLPPNSYAATLDSGALQDFNGTGLTYANIGLVDPFAALNAFDANGLSPFNLEWPKTTNLSFSIAKRIPLRQTIEVGYVGSWGRNLTSQLQQNILQAGTLSSGIIGNADLSNPSHRAGLTDAVVDTFRPFPAYNNVRFNENLGRTNYHSLQATLSRQSGDFQYLLSYTFGRNYGTVANDNGGIDPLEPERSEGIVRTDRRHIANLSWSWRLGAPFEGGLGAALLNDWNLSGISTYFSGIPVRIGFTGDISSGQMERAWYGTDDYQDFGQANSLGAITPTYSCDPRMSASEVGESIIDVSCLGIPAFSETGPTQPIYDTRSGPRSFHDLTVFKDFQLGGSKRLQLRFSAFNLFNQAFADPLQNDIDLNLDTNCLSNITVPNGAGGTSDICDPQGGFEFTQNTLANYGNIITKRGHRVIELAIRFFF